MQWIVDTIGEGFGQALPVEDILHDHHSPFQHIQVATSPRYGRMLILDDAVQTTERDEYIYHEMLVHLPLAAHPDPRRVLIIGGGDGGTLEEVLKHPVESVTMVEIDREVAFVESTDERFDAVLVDSTDPKGPGLALFSAAFYRACAAVLTPSGVLAVQSGSPLYQRDLVNQVAQHLAAHFPAVAPYWAAVPSYPGTLWSFTLARSAPGEAFRSLAIPALRYYSPDAGRAALNFPPLP